MQLMVLSIPLVVLLRQAFLSCENTIILEQSDKISYSHSRCQFWHTFSQMLKSKAGLLCASLITLGCGANFYSVYVNRLPPSWFYTFPDVAHKNHYFGQHLIKTWTHLTTFFIGLFAGHLCRSTMRLNRTRLIKSAGARAAAASCACSVDVVASSGSTQSSPVPTSVSPTTSAGARSRVDLRTAGASASDGSTSTSTVADGADNSSLAQSASSYYCAADCAGAGNSHCRHQTAPDDWKRTGVASVALASLFVIIFSPYNWSVAQELPSTLVASLYDTLSRLVWSIALVAITIQMCTPDDQHSGNIVGLAASALSHPLLVVLGRMSFLAYLLTPLVHTLILAVGEQLMFPSLIFMFHLIVGNFVIIYLLTLILAIVIEQPIGQLITRFILRGATQPRHQVD